MSLADELQRIADEAARTRQRLDELSRACAELRQQLSPEQQKSNDEAPQRLQSVS
jgi:prefoldin subunit 5